MSHLSHSRRPHAARRSWVVGAVAGLACATAAQAAVFQVAPGDVAGLAAAILSANGNSDCVNRIELPAGRWLINQAWPGTNRGLPTVQFIGKLNCVPVGAGLPLGTLQIVGSGMDATVIERASTASPFGLLAVDPGGNAFNTGLRLSKLTLRGGYLPDVGRQPGEGAAVRTWASTLSLDQVLLAGHVAGSGGAVHAEMASVFVTGSRLEGNTAANNGGAINGQGRLVMQRSSLSRNVAGSAGQSNGAQDGGGAINWRADAELEVSDSTFANNLAGGGGSGGAINIRGGSSVHNTIIRTDLRGNRANGNGGAVYAEGSTYLESSTLTGNIALGYPKAAVLQADEALLFNVTVAYNWVANGASVATSTGLLLHNSLLGATGLAYGNLPGVAAANCATSGQLQSNGYNLDSDGSCRLYGLGDVSVFDTATVLDPTARDNGGTTLTHALVPGGLAVDKGDPLQCRDLDQRGVPGRQDGNGDGIARCDIGAFELAAPLLVLKPLADSYVRTDLDIRRNDNYGLQDFLALGTGRGGAGQAVGAADQMRGLLRFDTSFLAGISLTGATLELSLHGYDGQPATTPFTVDVHPAVQAAAAVWTEGNGFEGNRPPKASAVLTDPDGASGVAWAGVGDNPAADAANNTSQPPFEPAPAARRIITREGSLYPVAQVGEALQWDLTSTARRWLSGSLVNAGVVLRDASTDGQFRGVRFGAREGEVYGLPGAVRGPRLLLNWTMGTTPADLNGDQCTDRNDLALLMAVIRGQATANSALAARLDLNHDGKVDVADARVLSNQFTKPLGAPCP